jgi:hypothetical protein
MSDMAKEYLGASCRLDLALQEKRASLARKVINSAVVLLLHWSVQVLQAPLCYFDQLAESCIFVLCSIILLLSSVLYLFLLCCYYARQDSAQQKP